MAEGDITLWVGCASKVSIRNGGNVLDIDPNRRGKISLLGRQAGFFPSIGKIVQNELPSGFYFATADQYAALEQQGNKTDSPVVGYHLAISFNGLYLFTRSIQRIE